MLSSLPSFPKCALSIIERAYRPKFTKLVNAFSLFSTAERGRQGIVSQRSEPNVKDIDTQVCNATILIELIIPVAS